MFFLTRRGVICFVVSTVQQAIVASSTYWVTKSVLAVNAGIIPVLPLVAFFTSMIVPHCLGYIIEVLSSKWIFDLYQKLVDEYIRNYYGQTCCWRNVEIKSKVHGIICHEAFSLVDELVPYLVDMYSTTLNVVFNAVVISSVVDSKFALIYILVFVLVALVQRLMARTVKSISRENQDEKVKFLGNIRDSWDNILIGNLTNFKGWKAENSRRLAQYRSKNLLKSKICGFSSQVTTIISIVPVFVLIGYLSRIHVNNSQYLLVLYSSLIRQIIVLNHIGVIIDYMVIGRTLHTRLRGVFNALVTKKSFEGNTKGRIDWENISVISVSANRYDSFHQFFKEIIADSRKPGRITIRGENGSGKSTLLLRIKKALGDHALYLPANSKLFFENKGDSNSTGENKLIELTQIGKEDLYNTYLLDEWDANLDIKNRNIGGSIIDGLALKSCVIEVLHGSH